MDKICGDPDIGHVEKLYSELLKSVCGRFGLSAIEAKIIGALKFCPDAYTAGEIAAAKLLSKGNVSTAVDKLIRRGFLWSETDKTDRRRINLYLTPAAEPICAGIGDCLKLFDECVFAGFTAEEKAVFNALKERMAANARAASRRFKRDGDR